jgi:hypothetical protein
MDRRLFADRKPLFILRGFEDDRLAIVILIYNSFKFGAYFRYDRRSLI